MIELFSKIEIFIKSDICKDEKSISLDDIKNYDDKKFEIVLTIKDLMISLSILSDYTYDLMVVEYESEKVVISKTKTYDNIDELFIDLAKDIEMIIKIK